MLNDVWAELSAYSIPEIIAVVASLTYVILAARNNRYCWPFAFIGSTIFMIVLWQHKLLMDSALNAYYALMAIYGWFVWNRLTSNSTNISGIQRWPIKNHLLAITLTVALTLLSGYWLATNTEASFPYLDSLTTWSSLLATWMIAKRILENWLYWIIIDVLSIYLYLHKSLFFTTGLFIVYVFIALYAYTHWKQQFMNQQATK